MELLVDRRPDEMPVGSPADATILVIEPMGLRRDWLVSWLQRDRADRSVIAAAGCPAELDSHLTLDPRRDLVLISIGGAAVTSPDVRCLLDELGRRFDGVPLILLADRDDADSVAEALRMGVRGFIPTSLGSAVADGALHLVQVGGTFVPPSAFLGACTQGIKSENPPTPEPIGAIEVQVKPEPPEVVPCDNEMTRRQRQVMTLLQQGKSNKVIAYELSMQECTVKAHIRNLMRKLRVTNRTQAALRAYELMYKGGANHPTPVA